MCDAEQLTLLFVAVGRNANTIVDCGGASRRLFLMVLIETAGDEASKKTVKKMLTPFCSNKQFKNNHPLVQLKVATLAN
jgi:hypothetical protein